MSTTSFLPPLCINNPGLTALYQDTLQRLEKNVDLRSIQLFKQIAAKAFTQKTIDRKGAIIKKDKRVILVRLKPGKIDQYGLVKLPKIFMIDMKAAKFRGGGKYCNAYAFQEIISGEPMVLKTAIIDDERTDDTLNDFRRSKRILKKINPFGTTPGIQEKPYATIGLSNPEPNEQVKPLLKVIGTLERRYDAELHEIVCGYPTLEERICIGQQLLEGLVAIHLTGCSHGDLKLDNALVIGHGGSIITHISDFGGAKLPIEEAPPYTDIGIFAEEYNLESDIDLEIQAIENKDWKKLHFYQVKRDIFEMGVVLAMVFTASSPFKPKENEYIQLEKSRLHRLLPLDWSKDFSQQILSFLKPLLDPDPHNRPTAADALKAYKDLIALFHPQSRHSI